MHVATPAAQGGGQPQPPDWRPHSRTSGGPGDPVLVHRTDGMPAGHTASFLGLADPRTAHGSFATGHTFKGDHRDLDRG